nr:BrxA family protein [Anaerocolumna sedimenticola]
MNAMNDKSLVNAIATQPADVAKQVCLYSIMMHSRLVMEFMLTVIGENFIFYQIAEDAVFGIRS